MILIMFKASTQIGSTAIDMSILSQIQSQLSTETDLTLIDKPEDGTNEDRF
jgi:hypothetical protein